MDVSTNSLSNSSQVDDASLKRKELEEEKNKKLKEEALLLRQQAEKTRQQMKSQTKDQLGVSYGSSDLVANSLGFDGAFSMAATEEEVTLSPVEMIRQKISQPAGAYSRAYGQHFSAIKNEAKLLRESGEILAPEQRIEFLNEAKQTRDGVNFWNSQKDFAKNLEEKLLENPDSLKNEEAKAEFMQYTAWLAEVQKEYDILLALPDSNPQKKEMMEDAEAEISDVQNKLEAFVA